MVILISYHLRAVPLKARNIVEAFARRDDPFTRPVYKKHLAAQKYRSNALPKFSGAPSERDIENAWYDLGAVR